MMSSNNGKSNKYIVVITNWFVYMGDVTEGDKYLRIENAHCIRVWGTTAGLGEIALNGPTPSTVLDAAGIVEVANHAVIMKIKCHATD